MGFENVVRNFLDMEAKAEMRRTDWGRKLDDVLTTLEDLVATADSDQTAQLLRTGDEIKRLSRSRMEKLEG